MILRQTFGDRGPHEIDWVRYMEIAASALRDVAAVLGKNVPRESETDHEKAYQRAVYATKELPEMPRIAFGARRTKQLIRHIFKRIGYAVDFWPSPLEKFGLPDVFRSWIIAHFEAKHFYIVYDGKQIEKATPSLFEADKLIAKTLLHECGHGVLHRATIREMIERDPAANPALEPRHEQEAWLYAILVWAVFAGDHALWTRKHANADMGWILA